MNCRLSRESALALFLALSACLSASAQTLPSDPIVVGDGRLTIGGDVSATFGCAHGNGPGSDHGCADDTGFFNYTDYEHSSFRALRFDVTASLRATRHLSILGEMRSENASRPEPYALYLRIRPWMNRNIDIQVGRVPPAFGAFARRTYASDNPLIGYPLAYQYLTSIRPDSLPANTDELLKMRGRGWLSNFSVGNTAPDRGVPLVSAFRWDTGAQIHAGTGWLDGVVSVTNGTVANPLVSDDNSGKQVSGRVALHPVTGLIVGASAARGQFPTDAAMASASAVRRGRFAQTAWGGDAEYSSGHYIVRFETILSDWQLPVAAAPDGSLPLRALSLSLEGRYKLTPRIFAAARFGHLGFSEIDGSTHRDSWDAPVTRVEVGGGYAIQRNLTLKASFQHNERGAGRVTRLNTVASQIVFWF